METLAPYCIREFNEEVHQEQTLISDSQLEEIRKIAFPLLKEHEKALDFASQLSQMSQEIADEKIILECENLVGQIDCRIENLESWIYDEETDQEMADLRIDGRKMRQCDHASRSGQVDVLE